MSQKTIILYCVDCDKKQHFATFESCDFDDKSDSYECLICGYNMCLTAKTLRKIRKQKLTRNAKNKREKFKRLMKFYLKELVN